MKAILCLALSLLAGLPLPAAAQVFPSHAITAVVGYPAGGPTDSLARLLVEPMKTALGQPVIVENIAGAGGSIGAGRVARANADGYTIFIGDVSTHVFNGAIYALPYDLQKDFQPIALLPSSPSLVLSSNKVPARNLAELLAWIKANEGHVSIGTAGVGSPAHISSVRLQSMIGSHAQLVPYKGAAPMMLALIAGEVDIAFNQVSSALPVVRAGKARAYAVTTAARLPIAPEIPTANEAGLPGFYVSVWRGVWAPKGIPADVAVKLNAAVGSVLADPALRNKLVAMGEDLPPADQGTPEALAAFQKAEINRWWPLIKAAAIKPE